MYRPYANKLTTLSILLLFLLSGCQKNEPEWNHEEQANYVFLFIGDGMGMELVNMAESYLAATKGEQGAATLWTTQFPTASKSTTYSASSKVTESAAAATALATGRKTNNNFVGIDPSLNRLESISEMAKKAGRKVGIASTVPLNHATPAGFFAHQRDRNMYYEIALDMIPSGFEFFAGAGLYHRNRLYDNTSAPDIYPLIEQAGYYIAKGYDDFVANSSHFDKIFLVQKKWESPEAIPYAIDRTVGDLSFKQITQVAIDVLTRDNQEGFFLMLEGGRIDWAAHKNDGATTIKEVIDMNEAIQVAFEFYKKHPHETLIVVTADHETGGLSAGKNMQISVLQFQKMSQDNLTKRIGEFSKSQGKDINWQDFKNLLTETMCFWKEVSIDRAHEQILHNAFDETFVHNSTSSSQEFSLLATTIINVMNDIADLRWSSGGHTASDVPVYAIGVGHELFKSKMDNTDIPKKIIKAAKYQSLTD